MDAVTREVGDGDGDNDVCDSVIKTNGVIKAMVI